ncbi:prephenate dehydratase, partial [Rhizophlyctis rosea]
DVFDAVESGAATYGVVPFENSTHGSVVQTLDRFIECKGGVQIRAESYLGIHHSLLVRRGTGKGDVRRVLSHTQALGQCQNWLTSNLPGVQRVPVSSTALAAERAAKEPGTAAICSAVCAQMFDLEVLESNIEDLKDNTTRFFILGSSSDKPSGGDLTLVLFTVDHRQPGALCDALAILKERGINLTIIESRPSRQRNWHYVFFIELTGHSADENVRGALDDMKKYCLDLRVLGSYPSQRPAVDDGLSPTAPST